MPKGKALVKKEKVEVEILTAEEIKKIDEAVEFINRQANAPARSLLEIGKYLLETFFESDPKKVDDRAPRKGISLRKLAEHKDIALNHQALSSAVKLAVQEDLFKAEKYKALTESHKLVLFRLGDKKEKLKFADKVVKEKLSVRKLHEVLEGAKLLPPRGRPQLSDGGAPDLFSSFIHPIEKLANFDFLFDSDTAEKLTDDQFNALSALKDKLEKLIELRVKVKK
jgi:hypothetical protein